MPKNDAITNQSPAAAPAKVTIDGTEYQLADLSAGTRTQLTNLRATDMEIAHLKQQLAIAQTARAAYANALKQGLPAKA
jgi:hypothetical protein